MPFAAYRGLTVRHLDKGTRELHGRWVTIVNKDAAVSTDGEYHFLPGQRRLRAGHGLHRLDRAQSYLQRLGFTGRMGVNAEAQKVATNTYRGDNSFYLSGNDKIVFGSGGVDDAEDEEVIWHEYGHAIQDAQVPGWGQTEQGGAMGEGFGDYWAYTMSQADSESTATTPLACIADWDAISYASGPVHCLRRVNLDLTVPDDVQHEVHADGRIWSRALCRHQPRARPQQREHRDRRGAVRDDAADRVQVRGQQDRADGAGAVRRRGCGNRATGVRRQGHPGRQALILAPRGAAVSAPDRTPRAYASAAERAPAGVLPGQHVADLGGGDDVDEAGTGTVAVFLIGMRFNRLRAVRTWWPVFTAMPRMLAEVSADPDSGMLGARSYWSGRVLMVVQYWRSAEALGAYARDPARLHQPAWMAFNRAAAGSGDVGIFHETYEVDAAAVETVYGNMPAFGLGLATATRPLGSRRRTRTERRVLGEPAAG